MKMGAMINTEQKILELNETKPKYCEVPLSLLPSNEDLGSIEPTAEVRKSIASVGVLLPILLIESPLSEYTGKYAPSQIADGKRRIKASRIFGFTKIPALIFPKGTLKRELLTLASNIHRKENILSELEAIENLQAEGNTEEQISKMASISHNEIHSRLKLGKLQPELREALSEGRIKPTVAEKASRLPEDVQNKLIYTLHSRLGNKAKITTKDVAAVKRVSREKAESGLEDKLFDAPQLESPPTITDWKKEVEVHLTQALNTLNSNNQDTGDITDYMRVYNNIRDSIDVIYSRNKD